MNTTKQKILIHSLELFNTDGISKVSLRTIAHEVGISIGNLQYHFKKREAIVEALYYELVEKIDAIIFVPNEDLLQSLLNISADMFTFLYDYRFFLLDFVSITRNNKTIKKHYAQLSKKRESEFLQIIAVFIQNGIFREEALRDEYASLYKRTEAISNFWFSSILIQKDVLTKKAITEYSLLIRQSIYPYLTDEAKKQYEGRFEP